MEPVNKTEAAEPEKSPVAPAAPPATPASSQSSADGRFSAGFVIAVCVAAGAVVFLPLVLSFGNSGMPSHPVYPSAYLKTQIQQNPNRLLLIILGRIYDVTKGKQFYAPGEEYSGYCQGTDHTRAFLSVDFEKEGGDDLSDLSPGTCLGIWSWSEFYVEKDRLREYPFVGLHRGRFYDRRGDPTEALHNFSKCVTRGEQIKAAFVDAAANATNCTRTELDKDNQRVGTWETLQCASPAVPRRCGVSGQEQRCICVDPPPVDPCNDKAGRQCKQWAENGQCETNPGYMSSECKRSCKLCKPDADIVDEDFPSSPKRYGQCPPESSSCTVRTK